MLVDTHTHFYDAWLLPEADMAVQRALDAGVCKMIQADVDSHERPDLFAVNDRHPGVLFPMLGLYPCSVGADWKEEIDRMLPYRSRGIVAVGEIGLDYHEGKENAHWQKEALMAQFQLAAEWDLPVNIHLRDAWEDFFSVLEACRHLHLRGILHCFTASYEIFERANRLADFSVGIGGVVTFKNAGLQGVVQRIPLEKIVLETDAPYIAPVPFRGRRNESAYLPLIATKVAELKGLTFDEVATVTTRNAETIYRI